MANSFHENLGGHVETKGSSDRTFGLVFAAGFALIAAAPAVRHGAIRIWPLPVAAVTAGVALLAPRTLAPLNRAWTAFGLLLGKIVNPIVMGVVFFAIFTPMALVMRLFGRDPLHLKTAGSSSLWRQTPPAPVDRQSLGRQF
jgi:predicted membrane metal-binding protein